MMSVSPGQQGRARHPFHRSANLPLMLSTYGKRKEIVAMGKTIQTSYPSGFPDCQHFLARVSHARKRTNPSTKYTIPTTPTRLPSNQRIFFFMRAESEQSNMPICKKITAMP